MKIINKDVTLSIIPAKATIQALNQCTPALVLFHGWGFDSTIWHMLTPYLTKYDLYLVDLPGFGGTPCMSWSDFKRALLLQLPQQFALLGWSMGGLFATRLACEAPMHVTHLLNVASSPRFTEDTNWPGIQAQVLTMFYNNLINNPEKTINDFIHLQQAPSYHARGVTIEGLQLGLNVLEQWDLRPMLNDIKARVAYIFGRLDTITSRKVMATMQLQYDNFDYHMISRAAHVPFLSHTNEFITLLDAFLL